MFSQNIVRNILCPVDFSEQSLQVLEHAARVSDLYAGASITVLNVVDDMAPEYAPYRTTESKLKTLHRTLEQDSQNRLKIHAQPWLRGFEKVKFLTVFGKPPQMITRVAKEERCDMIMMATRSMGLTTQFILGSTTYRIVRTAPCPLMVFSHPDQKFRALRVLFPTDFSELSLLSLPYVYHITREYDADLHLVHFRQTHTATPIVKDSTRELEALRRNAKANGVSRITVQDDIPGRSPGTAILDYAKQQNVDLTVLSAHGSSGYKQFFLGTTAVEVSSKSPNPVLLVRRTDWTL
ncbi:UspA domain protein [Chloroherpeton thalassium ATCC 35110]|uniref:UspA domain protein n=1 Tax=Chloroherpeton thalassium (strain ATCC 35110 / GB-78) TaxID=517418 RepID=B3QWV8_CHLT3|nr:universal stress protein [Chloroherpeton thalassium]ACF13322.1 UspA domain protein [Chloroherpeton thalassium ATCC 35110]